MNSNVCPSAWQFITQRTSKHKLKNNRAARVGGIVEGVVSLTEESPVPLQCFWRQATFSFVVAKVLKVIYIVPVVRHVLFVRDQNIMLANDIENETTQVTVVIDRGREKFVQRLCMTIADASSGA